MSPHALAYDDMQCVEVAEGRFRARWAAEGRDCRQQALGPEALAGSLVLPDSDDPEAFIRWAGEVQDQTSGRGLHGLGRDALVVLPARCDVLNEGVRHAGTVAHAGFISVSLRFRSSTAGATMR